MVAHTQTILSLTFITHSLIHMIKSIVLNNAPPVILSGIHRPNDKGDAQNIFMQGMMHLKDYICIPLHCEQDVFWVLRVILEEIELVPENLKLIIEKKIQKGYINFELFKRHTKESNPRVREARIINELIKEFESVSMALSEFHQTVVDKNKRIRPINGSDGINIIEYDISNILTEYGGLRHLA